MHAGSGTEVKVGVGQFNRKGQNPHPLPTPQRVRHPQKIRLHLRDVERSAPQRVGTNSEPNRGKSKSTTASKCIEQRQEPHPSETEECGTRKG